MFARNCSRLLMLGLLLMAGCTNSVDPEPEPKPESPAQSPLGPELPAQSPLGAAIHFSSVADSAGINFKHFESRRDSLIPEDVGSGVGWADYDNDGDEDLYFVNFAGPFLMDPAKLKQLAGNTLYQNNGDGTFTDVTETAGVGHVGWDYACLWLDIDNDGHLDLAVTHYNGVILYRNNGDGSFSDHTATAGLAGIDRFLLGMTASDYDQDGDLDLFLCGYVEFDRERAKGRPIVAGRPAVWTNPVSYEALPSILLQNDGQGVFTDATETAGVANSAGKSMQAIFCDFNDDGWPDLYIGNDVGTADAMYQNNGDGTFKDVSTLSGTFDRRASMGICIGDVFHRGQMDLFTTHWVNEDHALWKNLSGGGNGAILMQDVSRTTGLLEVKSTADVGWGTELVDFDNDGQLDLILENGSTIEDELTLEVLKNPKLLPQRSRVLRNSGDGQFVDVSEQGGDFFQLPLVARGLATADYDQDGRVDVAIVLHSGPGTLLRNVTEKTGSWLQVQLQGSSSNRFGIGARIHVTSGGVTYSKQSVLSSSYLSSNSLVSHFGLGDAAVIDSVSVTWPGGDTTELKDIEPNQRITVKQE